ncbi:MAG: hypothetical protein M3431_13395 [Actinomycetota bacterium]|nr:hypothetical protein [Actinomycetota bacterium]
MTKRGRVGVAALTVVGTCLLTAGGSWATTEPVDSTVPSTSEGQTTSTTSTLAPTTTLDPVAADTAAVTAAAIAARTARMDALLAPDDADVIATLDDLYVADGAAREEIDTRVQHLLDEGYRVRPNPDVPDSLTVESVSLLDGPPATTADVTACVVESAITYEPAAPESSEPEQVVDDSFRAFRTVYSLVNEGGIWQVDTASFVEEWPGETACPPPPTTTTATTTTLDPVAAEEALIAQRVQEIAAVRSNAAINLDAPGNAEALDASYTDGGTARQILDSDLQALRDKGWRVRPNPSVPRSIAVEAISLLDGPPATRADVQVCIIDPEIVYEPGGLPDGSDAIVDGETYAYRSVQHLLLEEGVWQLDEVDRLDEWTGVTACPPAM